MKKEQNIVVEKKIIANNTVEDSVKNVKNEAISTKNNVSEHECSLKENHPEDCSNGTYVFILRKQSKNSLFKTFINLSEIIH